MLKKIKVCENNNGAVMRRTISNYFSTNRVVLWSFFIALIWCQLLSLLPFLCPSFLRKLFACLGINKTVISIYYDIIRELSVALAAGIFFYLIFEVRNEKTKIKNQLNYSIYKYKQMKREILEKIILAEYEGLKPQNFDTLVEKNYLCPKEAQKYLTKNRLDQMINNLDDKPLRAISRHFQFFLESFHDVNYEFVQKEDFSLEIVFSTIKNMQWHIEEWLAGDNRVIDWSENAYPKSGNPFYVLFCQENDGEDPILESMLKALQKYN